MEFLKRLSEIFISKKNYYLTELTPQEAKMYQIMTQAVFDEAKAKQYFYYYDSKSVLALKNAKVILDLAPREKIKYLSYLMENLIDKHRKWRQENTSQYPNDNFLHILHSLHQGIIRGTLPFNEEEITRLFELQNLYLANSQRVWDMNWGNTIKQAEQFCIKNTINSDSSLLSIVKATIEAIEKKMTSNYYTKEKTKYISRLESLLHDYGSDHKANLNKPVYFLEEDSLGIAYNQDINQMPDQKRNDWFSVMAHVQNISGAKPTNKFLKEADQLLKVADNQWLKKKIIYYCELFIQHKEIEKTYTNNYNGREYTYSNWSFITDVNKDYLKGLIWLCAPLEDKLIWHMLSRVCERAYRKIPGVGPAAAAVGNACLYVLSQHNEGVGYLSRLKMRIRQANTQALIEKYLSEAAQKLGISTAELEDIVNDDFGLINGTLTKNFDDYQAILKIEAIGKTQLNWYKPDGTSQKSEPSFVKEKYKEELAELKNSARQIQTNLTTQRDRLDRELKLNREHTYGHFKDYFLEHGLMSFITKKLIWEVFDENQKNVVIWLGDSFVDVEGNKIDISENQKIRLWHPALYSVEEVRQWREFLNHYQIKQPIKQAYREIYLLTDAEINTRTYSNRMAAHILKQHQFNSLAKLRGWRFSLLGAYDKGYDTDKATIEIPEYQLKAEFWVSEVNADDAWNDTGIWLYISTDQIRFLTMQHGRLDEIVPLAEVPAIVLSEILRDVDLFVGVASVGNDPQWRDSGGVAGQYRDYWQAYSFGEIGETGKIRREIIARLLPKLKIANVAELQDKFLVIKGKYRSYKIHLQSTNILMTPNDQYLCIVPDRKTATEKNAVFLPFEGDAGLSVILSKAFLLANDDKITDSTITSQINRK
jgi:hypothetical protein